MMRQLFTHYDHPQRHHSLARFSRALSEEISRTRTLVIVARFSAKTFRHRSAISTSYKSCLLHNHFAVIPCPVYRTIHTVLALQMSGKVDIGTLMIFPLDDRVRISLVIIFYDRANCLCISVSHAMTERRTEIQMAFKLCAHVDGTTT